MVFLGLPSSVNILFCHVVFMTFTVRYVRLTDFNVFKNKHDITVILNTENLVSV